MCWATIVIITDTPSHHPPTERNPTADTCSLRTRIFLSFFFFLSVDLLKASSIIRPCPSLSLWVRTGSGTGDSSSSSFSRCDVAVTAISFSYGRYTIIWLSSFDVFSACYCYYFGKGQVDGPHSVVYSRRNADQSPPVHLFSISFSFLF